MIKNPYFNPEVLQKPEPELKFDKFPDKKEPGFEHSLVEGLTSIIIPAYFIDYSVFHYTGNCIGSVREHTDIAKTPYEIILVVNGKTHVTINPDNTYTDKVIENEANMGYAHAINQGLRVSQGEYFVLLNNDTLVFNHWLEDMHEALEKIDLISATPMYGLAYARAPEADLLRQKTMEFSVEETFSDFRDFSCVGMKRDLLEEIGPFDENFFAYKEDLDLYNRMDKAGKHYATSKRINIYHVIGATSVNMTTEDLHKDEGAEYYKKKYEV